MHAKAGGLWVGRQRLKPAVSAVLAPVYRHTKLTRLGCHRTPSGAGVYADVAYASEWIRKGIQVR